MSKVLCQVIGCGPAAMGLPVAADRVGELSRFLNEGVRFLDRAPDAAALNRLRFPFLIDANSVGGDFIAGVRRDGVFARAVDARAGSLLQEHHDRPVPLSLVGEFMNDLSRTVEEALPGGFLYAADTRAIHRGADGSWTSTDRAGAPLVTSESVVLATGSYEDTGRIAARYGIVPSRLIGSAELLAGRLDEAERVLRGGGRITIIGGSHSGFATAELLLARFGDTIAHGGLTLIHRGLSLAYTDLTETEELPPGAACRLEACPESGMVNRFHGLRAGPRGLCLRTLRGHEHRLILCETGSVAARAALAYADLVVHSAGYRTRQVPLYDQWGERIPMSEGTTAVDDRCRVLDSDLRVVPGVFGLGLGYARTDVWGRRRVGVNTFHGEDAEQVLSEVLAPATV
ncbi:hypothetical protein [Streptomyces monomycini]|uniref:hypothetical protein n=1 Tax=Streptomyces monomycini TaxID=371720 RepID=UPI0009968800|nr:hypothetical protein [Streptomyces monomycini]